MREATLSTKVRGCPPGRASAGRWPVCPAPVVVVVATALAYALWFDGDAGSPELLWGAVTMAAAAVLVGAARLWDRHRAS